MRNTRCNATKIILAVVIGCQGNRGRGRLLLLFKMDGFWIRALVPTGRNFSREITKISKARGELDRFVLRARGLYVRILFQFITLLSNPRFCMRVILPQWWTKFCLSREIDSHARGVVINIAWRKFIDDWSASRTCDRGSSLCNKGRTLSINGIYEG